MPRGLVEDDPARLLGQMFPVDGIAYHRVGLAALHELQACELIERLYSQDERFAQVYFNYRINILKYSRTQAWESTLETLEASKRELRKDLRDPYISTVGYSHLGKYHPVSLYCLRPVEEHSRGEELIQCLDELGLGYEYAGKRAILHSFSIIRSFRSLQMLKLVFVLIGLEAMVAGYDHLFFFISDLRLKGLYQRYGLRFPEGLKFRKSEHIIGCYSLNPENISRIREELFKFQEPSCPSDPAYTYG